MTNTKEYSRLYYQRTKEKQKEYSRNYRENHLEEIKEKQRDYFKSEKGKEAKRRYYEKHKEEIIKKRYEYRQKHKEEYNKNVRNYRKNNPDKVKTNNKNYYLKHRNKGILVWEQHYGKVPKGCLIIHKDGNNENNNIDNLEMITRKENGTMCIKGLSIKKDKNITETNILIARLMNKTYKLKKGLK